MSTRCNIRLEFGGNSLMIYRHWDGYPAETGADLAQKLQAAGKGYAGAATFLAALLNDADEGTSYRGPRKTYELTDDVHGDIDWAYAISFSYDGVPLIGAAERVHTRSEDPSDTMQRARAQCWGVDPFIERLVNPSRTYHNRRLEELKAKNPGSLYSDCEPYPMLEFARKAVA